MAATRRLYEVKDHGDPSQTATERSTPASQKNARSSAMRIALYMTRPSWSADTTTLISTQTGIAASAPRTRTDMAEAARRAGPPRQSAGYHVIWTLTARAYGRECVPTARTGSPRRGCTILRSLTGCQPTLGTRPRRRQSDASPPA